MYRYCILLVLIFCNGVHSDGCVTANFENDFATNFTSTGGMCAPHDAWILEKYSTVNIDSPHARSTSFIKPQETLSCISSFHFQVTNGGVLEVNLNMISAVPGADLISVIVIQIAEGGTIINLVWTPLTPGFVPGWHPLRVEIAGVTNVEANVVFMGMGSSDSIVLIDSFRYIPPSMDENECKIYSEDDTTTTPDTTTVTITETPSTTTTDTTTVTITETPLTTTTDTTTVTITETPLTTTTDTTTVTITETPLTTTTDTTTVTITETPTTTTETTTVTITETPPTTTTTETTTVSSTETPPTTTTTETTTVSSTETPPTTTTTETTTVSSTETPSTSTTTISDVSTSTTTESTITSTTQEPTKTETTRSTSEESTSTKTTEENATGTTQSAGTTISPPNPTDPPQNDQDYSFWNAFTISMVVILSLLFLILIAYVFYRIGKSRRKEVPHELFVDYDLPKPIIMPRVTRVFPNPIKVAIDQ